MLVTLPNLLYGPISMESGTYIYDIWSIQFFNIVYVSFPIIYYGLFDIMYSWKELKQKPNYYSEGQQSSFFNRRVLIKQLIETLLAAIFLVYTVFYSTEAQISGKGTVVYLEWSGNLVLAIVVVSCNLRVLLMSHQFNIIQGILIFLGIFSYYTFTFFISIILENEIKNTLEHQLSSGTYWFIVTNYLLRCFSPALSSRVTTCWVTPSRT
jgi:magnesium-transporting ATPase (P-type)